MERALVLKQNHGRGEGRRRGRGECFLSLPLDRFNFQLTMSVFDGACYVVLLSGLEGCIPGGRSLPCPFGDKLSQSEAPQRGHTNLARWAVS